MKLIALDLDGTLLRSDKSVSERSIEVLMKCKQSGSQVIVATARAPRSVLKLLPEAYKQEIWICYNGAEIYQGKERIYENLIPAESAIEIVERVEALFPESPLTVELEGRMFANQPLRYPWEYRVAGLKESITGGVAKILFSDIEPAGIDILNHQLPKDCRLLITDGGTLGTIMASSASKLAAIEFVCRQLGISLQETIAFGDDFNDMEMIMNCGTGVAMGNAIEELKQAANHVALTNDEDGVAGFLEEHFLLKAGERQ